MKYFYDNMILRTNLVITCEGRILFGIRNVDTLNKQKIFDNAHN